MQGFIKIRPIIKKNFFQKSDGHLKHIAGEGFHRPADITYTTSHQVLYHIEHKLMTFHPQARAKDGRGEYTASGGYYPENTRAGWGKKRMERMEKGRGRRNRQANSSRIDRIEDRVTTWKMRITMCNLQRVSLKEHIEDG